MNIVKAPLILRMRSFWGFALIISLSMLMHPSSTFANSLRGHVNDDDAIHIATTICGSVNNVLARGMLASMMMNADAKSVHLHLIVDSIKHAAYQQQVGTYQKYFKAVKLYDVENLKNQSQLMPLYESGRYTCAHMRLFYSELFPNIDYLLYVDTDTLVLGALSELWKLRLKHKTFMAALDVNVPEGARANYRPQYLNKDKKHFYYPTGINTGVMLMNTQRMREKNITGYNLQRLNDENVRYADQDILNTYAYYHPGKISILPCHWNKRFYSKCDNQSSYHYFQNNTGIIHGCNHEFFTSKLTFGYKLWEHYEKVYSDFTNSSMDIFVNGDMLEEPGQRAVFYIDEGKRRQVAGASTLISLGLDFDQVQFVSATIMNRIPLGERLVDASGVNHLKHHLN